ncbi:hypothetical protein NDU88_006240 [Pleurodeles waltl]|uniref:Uncharacterized protein n=1 Tax=Pleurodeles waltl TaxID=8319 RepID=A0AAV7TDC3_PLEWA|nr:hypothetical protein NDU88_006240 [Pleurodeles waltl]
MQLTLCESQLRLACLDTPDHSMPVQCQLSSAQCRAMPCRKLCCDVLKEMPVLVGAGPVLMQMLVAAESATAILMM